MAEITITCFGTFFILSLTQYLQFDSLVIMTEDDPDCLCELCLRPAPLSFHHLIPRRCHSNKWFRKQFSREEMQQGIHLCGRCHSFVHQQFGHKELGRCYNTKEKLLQAPTIQNYVRWARKQTNES